MIHRVIDLSFDLLARFWHLGLALCLVGFFVALMLALRIVRNKSESKNQRRAADAKNTSRTLSSLNRLSEHYLCLHELYIPRLDGDGTTKIHHVVLSKHGVFVLHEQHQRGAITGEVESREWRAQEKGRVTSFTNPILRNQYHLKALAKYLGAPEALFHSYIIFDTEAEFETTPPPEVLTDGIGRAIISHTSEIISPEMLERMNRLLRETRAHREPEALRENHTKAKIKRLRHTPERVA